METHRYARLFTSLVLGVFIVTFTGCEAFVEILDCNGYVERGYDIPDVVLVSNAERYVRDLETHPEVFYQTEGERLYFEAESSNYGVADAFTDEYGFLTVVAGHPGQALIEVEANDACRGHARTSFRVEVVRYQTTDGTAESK